MKFSDVYDLEDWMKSNGFKHVQIKSDNWVMSCCPFHDDKTPSFGINLITLRGHCFICGWFNWSEILEQFGLPLDIDFELVDAMTGNQWKNVTNKLLPKKEEFRINKFRLPDKLLNLKKFNRHYSYLHKRGFSKETIDYFNLSVCKDRKSKYFDRIICPVKDISKKLIFFEARTIRTVKNKKYIRPNNSPIKYCLGGIDKFINNKVAILTEGYFDMMKLWQYNLPSLCTFGINLHSYQVDLIMRLNLDLIVIGYDNDEAGNKAVSIAKEKLIGCGSKVLRLNMPNQSDPGDFKSKEEILDLNEFLKDL